MLVFSGQSTKTWGQKSQTQITALAKMHSGQSHSISSSCSFSAFEKSSSLKPEVSYAPLVTTSSPLKAFPSEAELGNIWEKRI